MDELPQPGATARRFRIVAAPATGEPLLLWLCSGSKQKPTGAIKQHPTCLVVRGWQRGGLRLRLLDRAGR